MKKLAIVSTHPIQYNAPLFKLLAKSEKLDLKVFYTNETKAGSYKDAEFGKKIEWDIPLLEDYTYEIIKTEAGHLGLIKALNGWKPDAILVYGWNFIAHLFAMFYFRFKIPVYFRGDSTLLDEKTNIKTLLRRIFLSVIYKFVTKAFYVGTNNKHYFLKHGLKDKQLIFAPHAIENKRFESLSADQEKLLRERKKALNIQQEDIVFLFVGKFIPKKNPKILIQAFNQINLSNTKLLMVGDGEMKQALKDLSRENRNIQFLDFQNQSQMPLIYRLANVLVLPSAYNETWGLAINEAMACKLGIIASNKVGSAIDLIAEGQNGYIFQSDDIQDLKNKIMLIWDHKHKIDDYGQYSAKIIQSWNYEIFVKQLENETS